MEDLRGGGDYLFTDSSQQNLTTTTEFFDHKNIKIDTKHEYADKMSNFWHLDDILATILKKIIKNITDIMF